MRHPTNANWLYAGTEVGVFASTNGGTSWSTTNDGPGNIPVDELFWLNASTLVAATHGRGMFKAGIGSGTLQFAAATQSVGEAAGTVSIDVTRTGGSAGAVGVNYATVAEVGAGKATAGIDYIPTGGTLSWNDGETGTKSFPVTIINDAFVEGDETFLVSLSTPTGGATLGAPSSMTVTIIDQPSGVRLLVPDGTSLKQNFTAYPETRWFAMTVEPGKTYVVEAADADGDLSANAIGTLGVFAPDGASAPPEANVDCTAANGPRPPAVDVASDGIRCVLRTALPNGTLLNKRPVYIKVTRMDPVSGGGAAQFKIRAREATIYGRWLTTGNDFHVEVENTTADATCVEVTRYPAAGLTYTPGPGWSGTLASFTLTVPAFGAVKQVIPSGSLVGGAGEGTLRLGACPAPTNLLATGLHVSTYAFDPLAARYIYFFTSTANDGKTRSTW